MHLAQRGGGDGLAIEAGEQLVGPAAQLAAHHLDDLLELHPLRSLREQPGHDAARLGRQRVGIHRQRLPELERRTLQLAQRSQDALGRLAQIRATSSAQLAARLLREQVAGRARGQVREPAQPAQPAGLDVIVVGHASRPVDGRRVYE